MTAATLVARTEGGVDGALAGLPLHAGADASELVQLARVFNDAAITHSTRRIYRGRFALFVSWCAARGLRALPVHPEVLRSYLVALAGEKKSFSTINSSRAAVVKAHQLLGHEPPHSEQLRATLRDLRHAVDPPKGIPRAMLKTIVTACVRDPLATRDRALLLVTYFASLGRAECAGLDREGVERDVDGYLLRFSNRDREGAPVGLPVQPDVDLCPARALDDWLVQRDALARGPDLSPEHGALFVALHRGGRHRPLIVGQRLSPKDVDRVLKRRAAAAGIDAARVSAQHFCAGVYAEEARCGASGAELRAHARPRHLGTGLSLRGEVASWST